MAETFSVQLQQFQGPFDLLLFFIERDELDIQDIPIAQITEDFLAYIHSLQKLNIEVASEFILVAATLMKIKAKMLIPRKELDAQGNEIDPRAELVNRLLEYKRYKEILDEIQRLEGERLLRDRRGNLSSELQQIRDKFAGLEELHSLDLYKLLKTFHKIIQQQQDRENQPRHVVITFPYSMEQIKERILQRVLLGDKLPFEKLLLECQSKLEAIFVLLSMLELLQMQLIGLAQGEGYNNFYLRPISVQDQGEILDSE